MYCPNGQHFFVNLDERPFRQSKITLVGSNFGPSKSTVVERNFGRSLKESSPGRAAAGQGYHTPGTQPAGTQGADL